MRKLSIFALPLLALTFGACGDDTTGADAGQDLTVVVHPDLTMVGNPDLTMVVTGDMAGFPAAPALGAQIDRMGRAGVNTALTDPFWDDATQTAAQHHMAQDTYNQASDPTAWATLSVVGGSSALYGSSATATVSARFTAALGVYDALNGTSDGTDDTNDGCGDQLAFGALSQTGYTTLTGVLADDRLYVNTASGTCAVYLGVEANVLGVTNTDCGGRTPLYNTIDITYTALAVGAGVTTTIPGCITGSAACAVSNGITSDSDTHVANETTFPFLGASN